MKTTPFSLPFPAQLHSFTSHSTALCPEHWRSGWGRLHSVDSGFSLLLLLSYTFPLLQSGFFIGCDPSRNIQLLQQKVLHVSASDSSRQRSPLQPSPSQHMSINTQYIYMSNDPINTFSPGKHWFVTLDQNHKSFEKIRKIFNSNLNE